MTAVEVIKQMDDLEQLLYIVEFSDSTDLAQIKKLSYEEIVDLYNEIHFS